jgi:ABC-type dipeptide/oligopeptide/nickel transport system permease subunit
MTITIDAMPATRRRLTLADIRLFFARPAVLVASILLVLIVLAGIFAPLIATYDPTETDIGSRLGAPDGDFWFGTDLFGRDVFSRVVWGARYSLPVGIATLLLGLLVGGVIGIVLGYRGGRLDAIGARVIDVTLGFPAIVLAIMVVSVMGVGLVNVVVAVAIAEIPRFARVVRSAVLVAKQNLYVESAIAMGASPIRIMALHILPAITPTIIVLGTLKLGDAILSTATLSFLGLGTQPPTPEWGAMLSSGREYMRYAPWMMIAPGLVLFITIISVNLIGDRMNELLDPRSARSR